MSLMPDSEQPKSRHISKLEAIESRLQRIEAKLDGLLAALAAESAQDASEGPTHDLDGHPMPGERDQNEPL